MSSGNDDFFEEQLRLAEEMSFLDEYELYFDPAHLQDTKERVKRYEDIVNEQLVILSEDEGAPLADAQIRDLFFSSLDSDKMVSDDSNKGFEYSPSNSERYTAQKDQKLKETVDSIRRSLRWYQNKIVKQIESTTEEDGKLAPLLELNDHVSSVLNKADKIAQSEKDNDAKRRGQKSTPLNLSTKSIRSDNHRYPHSPVALKEDPLQSHFEMQNIVNAVYSLRRVVDREETLVAVENLISICELEGEVNTPAVKQMMNAGALQVLLSVLSRAAEWPDVEMQISKVVSVLVAYEDDWALLQRSALIILSSLYTLQLKTQSRARSRSEALVNRLPYESSNSVNNLDAMSTLSLPSFSDLQSTYSDRLSISTTPQCLDPVVVEQQQQTQDIRAIVSAAVAKLSLALSKEWSKQELPFGEFPIPATSTMPISNSFQHGLDRVEKMRSLITRHSKNISRPSINDSNNMDSNRVLQVLLNLILTISEASLTTLENYELDSNVRTPTTGLPTNTGFNTFGGHMSLFAQNNSNFMNVHTMNNNFQEQFSFNKIDSFLISSFGVSFSTLLNHSLPHFKPKLVDNSAVLCSQALVNLAEVMACRPGLVAGGALRVIKSWLEIGIHILKYGYAICSEFSNQIYNVPQFQEFFLNLFGPVYELIANATAALMLLAGGSSDSKSHTSGVYFAPSNPLQSGGGRDYIIGWIDAQILAEGLPEVLVNLILASHESFLVDKLKPAAANQKNNGESSPSLQPGSTHSSSNNLGEREAASEKKKTILSTCVLPGQISKNIAKFLFQICSRPQNRHRLQGSSIPYILSLIFERSVCVVKYTIDQTLALDNVDESTFTSTHQSQSNTPLGETSPRTSSANNNGNTPINPVSPPPGTPPPPSLNPPNLNELYRKIFEFGMQEHRSHHPLHAASQHNHDNNKGHDPKRDGHRFTGNHSPSHQKKGGNPQESASSRFFGSFSYLSQKLSREHQEPNSDELPHNKNHHLHSNHSAHSQYKVSSDLMEMMSLITAACLDTIGYYFNDEISRQEMLQPALSTTKSSTDLSLSLPLISLMCHQRIMAAILMATSNLQKGVGRLAAIRIISSLTEWPESIVALYEGSIMDALLLISSEVEADLANANRVSESKYNNLNYDLRSVSTNNQNNNQNPLPSERVSERISERMSERERVSDPNNNANNIFPAKPQPAKRTTSNNSTISDISSNPSVSRKSHTQSQSQHSFHRGLSNMLGLSENNNNHHNHHSTQPGNTTPIHSISHLEDYLIDDDELLHQDMALEETLYVCYSLANLCLANPTYAYRMFSSGLLAIMLKIVKSTHLEISHQALRCIHAMCAVIAKQESEEAVTSMHNSYSSMKHAFSPRTNNRHILRELLEIITEFVKTPSHSPLVQKESILTLSQLCLVSEEFRDRIMDGIMRAVISILVNPTYVRELRSAAEEVLKNCGFQSGLKDFEVCGFDYEILKEWYFLKRSLKPQEIAKQLLNIWIDRLFTENEPIYGRQSLLFVPSTDEGGFPINPQSGGIGGAQSDPNLYQFSLANEIADLLKVTQFTYNKVESGSSLISTGQPFSGLPHLHRQFTDSLFKLLPICFPKFNAETSPQRGVSDDLDASYNNHRGSSMSSHSRESYGNNLGGGPSSGFTMNRSNYSSSALNVSNHFGGSTSIEYYSWIDRPPLVVTNMYDMFYSSKIHQSIIMDMTSLGVCIPVTTPTDESLLPSDNQDIDDLTMTTVDGRERLSGGSSLQHQQQQQYHQELLEELAFLIPHPHPIFAILLPSRIYQSFSRVGRVLQRMFDQGDPNQLYALTFRDCEYHGDFHTSLLATLQRCPQICSLSFSSSAPVEDDALLGHLVGQIPSTVRFISFRSTLSHESIQALCILLRTHNAAFLNIVDNDDSYDYTSRNSNSNNANNYKNYRGTVADSKVGGDFSSFKSYGSPPPMANEKSENNSTTSSRNYPNNSTSTVPLHSNKGILGLALTHLSLDTPEIQHIVELLQPRTHSNNFSSKTPRPKGSSATTTPTTASLVNAPSLKRAESHTSSNSSAATPRSVTAKPITPASGKLLEGNNHPNNNFVRGLKYLDLGYNNLTDSDCAIIFKAAISGPLEGLELGGNSLHKANKFIDVLTAISSAKQLALNPNRLRYLGLSNNGLSNKAFTGILYKLVDNTSLTSLDLSWNNIESSATNNESLRSFIKKNSSLRMIDLSHNRLTPESYRIMHLGLLENRSLLMLPLFGNQNVETSPTIELIQQKLRENRLIYKSQSKDFSWGFIRDEMDNIFYQTEDISSRISFSGINMSELMTAIPQNTVSTTSNTTGLNALEAAPSDEEGGNQEIGEKIPLVKVDVIDSRNSNIPEEGLLKIGGEIPIISSASSTTSSDGKKLSLILPSENTGNMTTNTGNNSNSVAIAVPVPSPRTTPSIPGTPKRFSGKLFSDGNNPFNNNPTSNSIGVNTNNSMVTTGNNNNNLISSNNNNSIVNNALSLLNTTGVPMITLPPNNSTSDAPTDLLKGPANASSDALPASSSINHHTANFSAHTLNVLFSAPLAGFDRSGKAHPLEVLDYTSERETLIQVFKEVHRDIAVHFDFATTDTLRTILSFGCKSLHFSGHGIPKGLCFEDGKSGLQVLREQNLKDLLSAGGLSLEFVFVSACYSKEIGEAFIKAGVSHVVCVKIDSKIQDAAAMAFTRAFYVAFLSGKTVKASFDIAKEALKLSPYVPDSVFEGDKFILLPEIHTRTIEQANTNNKNTNSPSPVPPGAASNTTTTIIVDSKYHENALFANRPSIDWPQPGQCTIGPNRTDLKQFLSRIRIPSPPSDFEGREVTMNSLIRNIIDRRLVSLVGEDGVGKSSVAAAICKYLADREFFMDGIVYLKAKGLKDFTSFLISLKHAILSSGNNNVSRKMQELIHQHQLHQQQQQQQQQQGHHHQHASHRNSLNLVPSSNSSISTIMSTSNATNPNNNTTSGNNGPSTSSNNPSSIPNGSGMTLEEEEMLFSALESMKLLIILDHLDDLLADFGDPITYLRLFLNRLFEQCPAVKILNVSTNTLSMYNIYIGSAGIVEYSISLGPLTLNSTLRLFAQLAPSLTTIHEKLEFIECLQPPKQYHVTFHSREISVAALQILQLFGQGHPAKIVHMACESTSESVEELKRIGKRIILQTTAIGINESNNNNSSSNNTIITNHGNVVNPVSSLPPPPAKIVISHENR